MLCRLPLLVVQNFNTSFFVLFFFRKRAPTSKGIEDADVMGKLRGRLRYYGRRQKRRVYERGPRFFCDDNDCMYDARPQIERVVDDFLMTLQQ